MDLTRAFVGRKEGEEEKEDDGYKRGIQFPQPLSLCLPPSLYISKKLKLTK